MQEKQVQEENPRAYELSTINEAVSETIMRDLRKIKNKLLCVLRPRSDSENDKELRNCLGLIRGFMGSTAVLSFLGDVLL